MKTNIQALMNLISEMEKNLNNLTYVLDGYAINTSVQELDGKINIIEDNKEEFDLSLAKIEKDINEISRLKAILYQKNNEFKLSDGRNIQEAIVDNTNLRKLLKEEAKKGKIVIVASHIKEDIINLANITYKFDGGKVTKI